MSDRDERTSNPYLSADNSFSNSQWDSFVPVSPVASGRDRAVSETISKYTIARFLSQPVGKQFVSWRELEQVREIERRFPNQDLLAAWLDEPTAFVLKGRIREEDGRSFFGDSADLLPSLRTDNLPSRNDFQMQLEIFSVTKKLQWSFPALRKKNLERLDVFEASSEQWKKVATILEGDFDEVLQDARARHDAFHDTLKTLYVGPPEGVIDRATEAINSIATEIMMARISQAQEYAVECKTISGLGMRSDVSGHLPKAEKALQKGDRVKAAEYLREAEKEIFESDAVHESMFGPEDVLLLGAPAAITAARGSVMLGRGLVRQAAKKGAMFAADETLKGLARVASEELVRSVGPKRGGSIPRQADEKRCEANEEILKRNRFSEASAHYCS